MIKTDFKKQSGFSIVEAIIYIALFVMLSLVLIDSLMLMGKAYNEVRINRDLLESANTAVERLSREIRNSQNWDSSGSVFGTNPGVLKLDTTKFELVGGNLQLTNAGVVEGALTLPSTKVTSMIFKNINTTYGKAVRFEITIQSLRSSSGKSISIEDTITLRKSY